MIIESERTISEELVFHETTRTIINVKSGKEKELSPKEAVILSCLIENRGHISTYKGIQRAAWPDVPDELPRESIRPYILEIRKALRQLSSENHPDLIKTIRGNGYMLQNSKSPDEKEKYRRDWEYARRGFDTERYGDHIDKILKMVISAHQENSLFWNPLSTLFGESVILHFKISFQTYIEDNNFSANSNFAQWLVSPEAESNQISMGDGHTAWITYCKDHINDTYALEHAFEHCIQAKDLNSAAWFLKNKQFQINRIDKKDVETAITLYVDELVCLYNENTFLAEEAMLSDTFSWILSDYATLFYRNGLFFKLSSSCGLNVLLEKEILAPKATSPDTTPDAPTVRLAAAAALCFYATETYPRAQSLVPWILKNEHALEPDVRNELRNLMAICYLKDIQLDLAKGQYQSLRGEGTEADKADACMGLAKIACYQSASIADKRLAWDTVCDLFREADAHLSTAIKAKSVLKSSNLKRLRERQAEYCRFAALLGLWMNGNESSASNEMLCRAKAIYDQQEPDDCTHRYYFRFLTTKQALEIVQKRALTESEFEEVERSFVETQASNRYIVEEFEHIQAQFWLGVAAYKCGKSDVAKEHLMVTMQKAVGIKSWIEAVEAAAVYDALSGESCMVSAIIEEKDSPESKGVLKNWASHIVQVLGLDIHSAGDGR